MDDREPAAAPEPPAAATTTCYRHPDRETYVRCTRCDRPICPDCMRPASVGFQCPECVRGGGRVARQGRTTFGGRVPRGRVTATVGLVAVNVAVFVAMVALDPGRTLAGNDTEVHRDFAMWPLGVAVDHEYYRLLTAMFLHYGPVHLLFNMYALVLFGPALESRLGALRFLALYLVAGLGASAVSYAFSPLPTLAAGASGAVFGLFAAYAVVAVRLRYDVQGIAVYIALSLLIGLVIPNIDVRAHVGGLVTGALAGATLALPPRGRWRSLLQWGGLVVVLAAVVLLVVIRSRDLTGRF